MQEKGSKRLQRTLSTSICPQNDKRNVLSMHLLHMQNLTSHVNLVKSSSFTFTTISCIHYEHTVNTLAEIFAYGYVQKFEILRKKIFFLRLGTKLHFHFV